MTISKETFRSGPYRDFFAQGVKVGNTLYLAGQIGVDADGNVPEDIVEQTRLAYSHIESVLNEFDATMDNIVDETVFVTDMKETMEKVGEIFTARAEAYGSKPEVSQALVQVAGLVLPELKIEIKCIAHL